MPENDKESPIFIIKKVIKSELPPVLGKAVLGFFEHPEIALRIQMAPLHCNRAWDYAYAGGLVQSIADRCAWVDKMDPIVAKVSTGGSLPLRQQLFLCVLLQDIFCLGDVFGNPHFVPNILKSGKQSTAEPFKTNPDAHRYNLATHQEVTPVDRAVNCALDILPSIREDGDLSVMLIYAYGGDLFGQLSPDVVLAIRLRHGLYGKNQFLLRGRETPLTISLNFLNLWSSRMAKESVTEQNDPALTSAIKLPA